MILHYAIFFVVRQDAHHCERSSFVILVLNTKKRFVMDRAISASEANQRFSEMLRDVQGGESFVVLSRGRPVARVVPVDDDASRAEALKKLLADLKTLPRVHGGDWTREDLYK